MIYTREKNFDDRLIRSIDAVVDQMLNMSFAKDSYLTDEQYVSEYRTLMLNLPRRCGKTTYLQKVCEHFNGIKRGSALLFTKDFTQTSEANIVLLADYAYASRGSNATVLLFDEVKASQVKLIVPHIITHSGVVPSLVLALGTGI
jgi:predicted AAA+ superfamily ATPase